MMNARCIIVVLYLLTVTAKICDGQCPPDDSIRRAINIIKNEQADGLVKIKQLAILRTSYLKCRPKNGAVYAEILHNLGGAYNQIGNLELAIAYTGLAVDINEHTGRREAFLCNSYYNLGLFYSQLNWVHQSDDCFNHCINIGSRFPGKFVIAGMACEQLSFSLYNAGDYQQARDIASEGLSLFGAVKDTIKTGILWAQKAQAEIELGDFKEAKKSIERSLMLLADKTGIELAPTYSIYADFLNAISNHKESLVYYGKAFQLNKKFGIFGQCANNQNDMGNVYDADLKQEDNARNCFYRGLLFARKAQNSYLETGLYENIGVTYWREHNFKKALLFYQKGLNALPISFKNRSVTSNPLADALSKISNDYYVSTLFANKAESLLGLYKQSHDKILLTAALQTFLLADRSVDMMRWKQLGELSKLIWRNETKEMYANAIEVCYLLNDTENAFYFFEKSRSVLLNDQLNSLRKVQILPGENSKMKLLGRIDSLNGRLISLNDDKLFDTLKKEFLAAHQEYENQQNQFTAELSEDPVLVGNSPQFLKTVQQRLLNSAQSLVEYFNTDTLIYALVITSNKVKVCKIPYAGYIHDSADFLKYCSNAGLLNRQYEQYTALAWKIYQKLLMSLKIKTQRIIVSPGDNFIPFDALIDDPKTNNSFLIKKYAFSYVYSMRVLMNYHQGKSDQNIFLGFAPENYNMSPHLEPLPGSAASLKRIKDGLGTGLLLKGDNATKSQLLSMLPQSQIVQIYSHAVSDNATRDPLLYMADSSVLMSDIQKLHCRHTDLVVLSACNTGAGYNAVGEGIFSLARGFRLAGIPTTVTNLWQADNQVTYELTESFYKYLKQGKAKDMSLRLAKLDLLKRDELHLLPYYWATTIVLGDSSALIIPQSAKLSISIQLVIFAVFFIALACCIYFFASRSRKNKK